MNRFTFHFIVLLSTQFCFAQSYDWRWARGATSNQLSPSAEGIRVATDSSENLFVCGYYGFNISFGPYNLNGRVSSFIAKYDSTGNIKWAKGDSVLPAGVGGSDAFGVCTDEFGNCYVCGGFQDTVYFGSHQLIATNYGSTYLVKYDSNGNVLWAKNSHYAHAWSYSCAIDLTGNIYITGDWNGDSITFGSQTLFDLNGNVSNVFLAKYDSSGNVLWARSSGSISLHNHGWGVATDYQSNVYVTGSFDTTSISFGTDTITNVNPHTRDIFLVKYDSTGNVIWAQSSGKQGDDDSWDIACDAVGNIFQVSTVNFYDTANISKYDSFGNLLWTKIISGYPGGNVNCYSVTTDKNSNVYATGGFFYSPVDIGGDTILQLPPAPGDPMFIVKYDPNGHLLFAKAVSNGGDDNCDITITNSGNIYLGGDYTASPFVVGNDTLTGPVIGTNGEQVFVAKLICKNILSGFNSNTNNICGAPACIDFTDNSTGNASSWKWFFPGAIPDSSLQQNPSNICYTNAGNYDVTLVASDGNVYDTLTLTNYITIYPTPAFSGINQVGDTLFSLPGFVNYQWYEDTTLINGTNNYYFVATHNGNYSVDIIDSNGCFAAATLINVIASMKEINNGENNFSITYSNSTLSIKSAEELPADLKLSDALGKLLYATRLNLKSVYTTIEISLNISPGVYIVSLSNSKEICARKIFVE